MQQTPEPPEGYKIETLDQAEAAGAIVATIHTEIKKVRVKSERVSFAAQRIGARISELNSRLARYELALQEWAQKNRKLMGDQKTLVMRHIIVAFKLSRPAVKFLEGWTIASVLAKLRKSAKLKKAYIRTKEDLDRQSILRDARPEVGKLDAGVMRRFGIEVVQDEHFYVDPKVESTTL